MSLHPNDFFTLENYAHRVLFNGVDYVWEALNRLDEYLESHARRRLLGDISPHAWIEGDVLVASGATVESGAMISGPAIIGPGTVVRHGAYIRGHCVTGEKCVIGHTTEIKRAILLDHAHAAHFNYVGDSILGNRTNLGAGTKLSNLKNDGSPVVLQWDGGRLETGLRKLGAVLGDGVQTGCNCVTSPGTLVGPESHVYANAVLRGVYPAQSIIKLRQEIEVVERRG